MAYHNISVGLAVEGGDFFGVSYTGQRTLPRLREQTGSMTDS